MALLWLSSTPMAANLLLRAVERGAERAPAIVAPHADAIVVLSGGRVMAPGPSRVSEWADPDRFFGGLELFRAAKAPVVVFTGGWAPWEPDAPLEGDFLKGVAVSMGIDASQVLTTGRVANTAEEAKAVALLLQPPPLSARHILLVTSAFHIPRATALFEAEGFTVSPFPVDFSVPARPLSIIDLIPNPSGLMRTQTALRELYGRLYYYLFSRSA